MFYDPSQPTNSPETSPIRTPPLPESPYVNSIPTPPTINFKIKTSRVGSANRLVTLEPTNGSLDEDAEDVRMNSPGAAFSDNGVIVRPLALKTDTLSPSMTSDGTPGDNQAIPAEKIHQKDSKHEPRRSRSKSPNKSESKRSKDQKSKSRSPRGKKSNKRKSTSRCRRSGSEARKGEYRSGKKKRSRQRKRSDSSPEYRKRKLSSARRSDKKHTSSKHDTTKKSKHDSGRKKSPRYGSESDERDFEGKIKRNKKEKSKKEPGSNPISFDEFSTDEMTVVDRLPKDVPRLEITIRNSREPSFDDGEGNKVMQVEDFKQEVTFKMGSARAEQIENDELYSESRYPNNSSDRKTVDSEKNARKLRKSNWDQIDKVDVQTKKEEVRSRMTSGNKNNEHGRSDNLESDKLMGKTKTTASETSKTDGKLDRYSVTRIDHTQPAKDEQLASIHRDSKEKPASNSIEDDVDFDNTFLSSSHLQLDSSFELKKEPEKTDKTSSSGEREVDSKSTNFKFIPKQVQKKGKVSKTTVLSDVNASVVAEETKEVPIEAQITVTGSENHAVDKAVSLRSEEAQGNSSETKPTPEKRQQASEEKVKSSPEKQPKKVETNAEKSKLSESLEDTKDKIGKDRKKKSNESWTGSRKNSKDEGVKEKKTDKGRDRKRSRSTSKSKRRKDSSTSKSRKKESKSKDKSKHGSKNRSKRRSKSRSVKRRHSRSISRRRSIGGKRSRSISRKRSRSISRKRSRSRSFSRKRSRSFGRKRSRSFSRKRSRSFGRKRSRSFSRKRSRSISRKRSRSLKRKKSLSNAKKSRISVHRRSRKKSPSLSSRSSVDSEVRIAFNPKTTKLMNSKASESKDANPVSAILLDVSSKDLDTTGGESQSQIDKIEEPAVLKSDLKQVVNAVTKEPPEEAPQWTSVNDFFSDNLPNFKNLQAVKCDAINESLDKNLGVSQAGDFAMGNLPTVVSDDFKGLKVKKMVDEKVQCWSDLKKSSIDQWLEKSTKDTVTAFPQPLSQPTSMPNAPPLPNMSQVPLPMPPSFAEFLSQQQPPMRGGSGLPFPLPPFIPSFIPPPPFFPPVMGSYNTSTSNVSSFSISAPIKPDTSSKTFFSAPQISHNHTPVSTVIDAPAMSTQVQVSIADVAEPVAKTGHSPIRSAQEKSASDIGQTAGFQQLMQSILPVQDSVQVQPKLPGFTSVPEPVRPPPEEEVKEPPTPPKSRPDKSVSPPPMPSPSYSPSLSPIGNNCPDAEKESPEKESDDNETKNNSVSSMQGTLQNLQELLINIKGAGGHVNSKIASPSRFESQEEHMVPLGIGMSDFSPPKFDDSAATPSNTDKLKDLEKLFPPPPGSSSTSSVSPVKKAPASKLSKLDQKKHMQERVANLAKKYLKPYYTKNKVSKEQYKHIMRRVVNKCTEGVRKSEVKAEKVKKLVGSYVSHMQTQS